MSHPDTLLKAKIISETALVSWLELQRFFAQGKVIKVCTSLDLVEVAFALARNDQTRINAYIAENTIKYVNDDDAKQWFTQNKLLWASVVKPWVLVQEQNDTPK